MKLTKSERRILQFYKSLGKQFCRSLQQIAKACSISTKTVVRANRHFERLGILIWAPGHGIGGDGIANKYLCDLHGIHGYQILGVTPAMLRSIRGQVSGRGWGLGRETANKPNQPNRPNQPN